MSQGIFTLGLISIVSANRAPNHDTTDADRDIQTHKRKVNKQQKPQGLLGTGRMGGRRYGGGGRGRLYTYRYSVTTTLTCIKMGSDESHFNVSLIVRDKVTRQCPQTTRFEEKKRKKKKRRSGIEPTSFRLPAYRLTARPNRLSDAKTETLLYFIRCRISVSSRIFFGVRVAWGGGGGGGGGGSTAPSPILHHTLTWQLSN